LSNLKKMKYSNPTYYKLKEIAYKTPFEKEITIIGVVNIEHLSNGGKTKVIKYLSDSYELYEENFLNEYYDKITSSN